MECPPCSWGPRWEAYHHEEAGAARLGRNRIQMPVDRQLVKWFFIRCTEFQLRQFEGDKTGSVIHGRIFTRWAETQSRVIGGSVKYQTCLIFCQSTMTSQETTIDPN